MPPRPSVSVVVAVLHPGRLLDVALGSLRAQRYEGEVDLVLVHGGVPGELDETAARFGGRILPNPRVHEEAARALGVAASTGELVLLLDADNELPHEHWLTRLVDAILLEDDVVAADSLFHEYRRTDPALTRLCALIGGTDPIAVELGWADRWALHLSRWTGMPVLDEQRVGDTLIVRLDPDRPPPMGSNGFLVRREALLRTRFSPDFVHSDCVGDLAADGQRFARVPQGIVHHYAPDLKTYWRKAKRRSTRSVRQTPKQRRGFRPPPSVLLRQGVFSGTLVGPTFLAIRGWRRRRDAAWALYPIISLLTVLAYARATVLARLPSG